MGGGRRLWAGSLFVGAGLSIVAGGARSRGRGVRGCSFVVRGRGGDVSSVVWSSLTRLEGTRVGVLTIADSIRNNDERRHSRRSSFGCHVALSDVAPANPPSAPPSFPFRCDVALVVLAVVVVGVGDGCTWRPLATVTMVVVVKRGWRWQ